jgi:hypothetical protein
MLLRVMGHIQKNLGDALVLPASPPPLLLLLPTLLLYAVLLNLYDATGTATWN